MEGGCLASGEIGRRRFTSADLLLSVLRTPSLQVRVLRATLQSFLAFPCLSRAGAV